MSTKYTYSVENDFPNQKINMTTLEASIEAADFSQDLISINVDGDNCDIWFVASILSAEQTELDGIVAAHTGAGSTTLPQEIKIIETDSSAVLNVDLPSLPVDKSGKLRVQQTPRALGTATNWTGVGDDPTDITNVGGGSAISFFHDIGDSGPIVKYIDLNIAENETWIYEGYIIWKGANFDTISFQIVPRTVTVSGVSGGDKTIYGGYLVVPTAPGAGDYEVANDLTDPSGGLVYMPDSDDGTAPTAYWDADYNTTTHQYENIQPNYTGTGRYNIFSYEVVFQEFIRQMPLLADGVLRLGSNDAEELGQGMRLKLTANTNSSVPDHDWAAACMSCLYRNHTI